MKTMTRFRLDVVSCPISKSFCLSSLWLHCAVWAHSVLRPVLWNVTSSVTTGRVERQKRSDCFQGLQRLLMRLKRAFMVRHTWTVLYCDSGTRDEITAPQLEQTAVRFIWVYCNKDKCAFEEKTPHASHS